MKKIVVLIISLSLLLLIACQKNDLEGNEKPAAEFVAEVTLPDEVLTEIPKETPVDEVNEKPVDEKPVDEVDEKPVDEVNEPPVEMTKDEVLWLQESLKILGYYTALDGDFGPATKKQLKAFQENHGLDSFVYNEATKVLIQDKIKDKAAPGMGTMMILLNKNYHLPSDYVPEGLREVKALKTKSIQLPDEVATQTELMIAQAQKEGLNIYLVSGYRSYAYQENIFSRRVASHGFESAEKIIAIPGQSEHQTGLAIDVSTESVGLDLKADFDKTPEFQWLMTHCHEYGFILRYLENQTEETGYVYEPWHYRYIKDPEIAKVIMDGNMTLEAYLDQ